MADPIIIVDARGTEHEFPSGFDPVQAAGIVRAQAGGTETDSPAKAFLSSLDDTTRTAVQHAGRSLANTVDPRTWLSAMEAKSAADNPDAAGVTARTTRPTFSTANIRPNVADMARHAKDELSSLSTPEGGGDAIGSLTGMLALGRVPQGAAAVRRVPIRAPLAAGLEVAGEALNNPAMGLVSPRAPHAGKLLTALGRSVSPSDSGGPVAEGFERYGGPSTSGYKAGASIPEAPSAAIPGLSTPQGTYVKLPDGTFGIQGHGLTPGQTVNVMPRGGNASLKTVGDILKDEHGVQHATIGAPPTRPPVPDVEQIVREKVARAAIRDEAGSSLGGYAGPERRVSGPRSAGSGPDARQIWEDRNHAIMLERLGGRDPVAVPPPPVSEAAMRARVLEKVLAHR